MWTRGCSLWVLTTLLLVGLTLVTAAKAPLKKRSLVMMGGESEQPSGQNQKLRLPAKRTFCNAFTGCGRKRSDGSVPISKDYEYDHESTGGGETSYDSSVDDIARDILAEARLWEALQARNSIRSGFRRQPGFFPRQRRSTDLKKPAKNSA